MASSFKASRGGASSAMAQAKSLGLAFSATPIQVAAYDETDPSAPLIGRRLTPELAPHAVLEPLETRELMSVSLDSAGFTVVAPAADSRIVYVSSSGGSDSNSGLSEGAAVKTLAKAITLIRDNSADQLLLKRGDSWKETFGYWKKSGRSASNPILISAYGIGDRPLIKSDDKTAMFIGSVNAQSISHLVIEGIHFYANGRDPQNPGFNKNVVTYAIQCFARGEDITIEDVKAEYYHTNISCIPTYGQMHDLTLRRNVLTDAYGTDATKLHPQGFFADSVQGLTLEENIFDHNGWAEGVSGAEPKIWNHNAYLTGSTSGVVVRNNVFANASAHGLQARSGGIVTGNLFMNNPIGLSYGLVNGSGVVTQGGVWGEVSDNVFIGSRDINGEGRGVGLEIGNIKAGADTIVQRNIFTQYADGSLPAIMINSGVGVNQTDAVGTHDLLLKDNIVYKWDRGLSVQPGMGPNASVEYKTMSNVVLRGNDFVSITTGKTFINAGNLDIDRRAGSDGRSITGRDYSDPDRTVAQYADQLGGVNADWQFTAKARKLSGNNWDTRYTAGPAVDFIRTGFGLPALSGGTTNNGGGNNNSGGGGSNTGGNNNGGGNSGGLGGNNGGGGSNTGNNNGGGNNNSGGGTLGGGGNNGGGSSGNHTPSVGHSPHVRGNKAPVYVRALSLNRKHHQLRMTIRFSRDVGSSLELNDLALQTPNGQAIDLTGATFSYNAKKHRAQIVLSKDTSAAVTQKGKYLASINTASVTDTSNYHLDGNHDGTGGDNFSKQVKIQR